MRGSRTRATSKASSLAYFQALNHTVRQTRNVSLGFSWGLTKSMDIDCCFSNRLRVWSSWRCRRRSRVVLPEPQEPLTQMVRGVRVFLSAIRRARVIANWSKWKWALSSAVRGKSERTSGVWYVGFGDSGIGKKCEFKIQTNNRLERWFYYSTGVLKGLMGKMQAGQTDSLTYSLQGQGR